MWMVKSQGVFIPASKRSSKSKVVHGASNGRVVIEGLEGPGGMDGAEGTDRVHRSRGTGF